jgi:DNA uptake protein ComE-like DNA-binding protein
MTNSTGGYTSPIGRNIKHGLFLDQDTPPGSSPPAPAPPEPKDLTLHDQADGWLDSQPEHVRGYIKHLRGEAKDYRLKLKDAREEATLTKTELSALKTQSEAAETKRLEEEKRYKELYEQEKTRGQEMTMKSQAVAINTKLEAELIKKGLPGEAVSSILKLVNRSGISIDGDGFITGVDAAIERTMQENDALLKPLMTAKPPVTGGDGGKAEPDPKDNQPIPGFPHMTYGQLKALSVAANGGDPKPAGQPPAKKFNALTASKAEADAYYKELTRKAKTGR